MKKNEILRLLTSIGTSCTRLAFALIEDGDTDFSEDVKKRLMRS